MVSHKKNQKFTKEKRRNDKEIGILQRWTLHKRYSTLMK
jgi:hypothetical protein